MINMLLSEAANSLQARLVGEDINFTGCNTDSRTVKAGEMFIALHGEHFDGHDFVGQAVESGASAAMVDRELDQQHLPLLIVKDSRKAMGALAKHWRSGFEIPLVAVTGSNGKTTVKEMLTSILSLQAPVLSTHGNLNNDIGVPLTLFSLGNEHRHAVVEMGANHPGEIAWLSYIARPTVAVITQCAPAHLEGFGSIEGIAHAKSEIFEGLSEDGTAIVNADDDYASLWRNKAKTRRQISFGMFREADITATHVYYLQETGRSRFNLHSPAGEIDIELPLPGGHNILNALAVTACSLAINIPLSSIKTGLEQMHVVKGRLQIMKGLNNSRVYDDSYNANPASFEAALTVLSEYKGKRWVVLGDMAELGNSAKTLHQSAGEAARLHGVERLYCLGQLSKYAVAGFGKGAQHFLSIEELIAVLQTDLDKDVTLMIKGSRAMAMERIVAALVEEN